MTREEAIEYLYKHVADKTLSFGCIVDDKFSTWIGRIIRSYQDGSVDIYRNNKEGFKDVNYLLKNQYIIIGHPIMIGDFLKWAADNIGYEDKLGTGEYWYIDINEKRKYKEKPIDDQTDECIFYLVDLVSKYTDD